MTSPSDVESIVASAKWKPNSEKQNQALASRADITIYGGARGGGKTLAALMAAARHVGVSGYTATIFRKDSTQIHQPDGLWDTAQKMYPLAGGVPNETRLWFKFPSGAKIGFGVVQRDADLAGWKGAQIAFIGFDQLEEFTRKQFWELQACNRSTSGVANRVFATCNPNPDSFLRKLIDWWIGIDGYAIEARSGHVRFFAIIDDIETWASVTLPPKRSDKSDNDYDSAFADACSRARAELTASHGPDIGVQSLTFIAARVEDNVDLMRLNPQYRNKLMSGRPVDRERFWLGNWNMRESAGDYFKREQFKIYEAPPPLIEEWRYWDRAASTSESASWTVGVRMGRDAQGRIWITDVIRFRAIAQDVKSRIHNVTAQDGRGVSVGIEGDPGQAGKAEAESYVTDREMQAYHVVVNTVRESKGARALPLSSQVAVGNVYLVKAAWNEDYLREMANFDGSDKCVADQVDASSGAYHMITGRDPDPGVLIVDAGSNGNGNGNKDVTQLDIQKITDQIKSAQLAHIFGDD